MMPCAICFCRKEEKGKVRGGGGVLRPTRDRGASLTCRFRTLSETFSWDML